MPHESGLDRTIAALVFMSEIFYARSSIEATQQLSILGGCPWFSLIGRQVFGPLLPLGRLLQRVDRKEQGAEYLWLLTGIGASQLSACYRINAIGESPQNVECFGGRHGDLPCR